MRWSLPHPSRRQPVLADRVIATSHPLAVSAGLAAFEHGGNAADAALAAAICLTVVEPTSNGIGSDAFALVSEGGRLHGLNASGRAPRALDPEPLLGLERMPERGWPSVTVPGAVSAWAALSERFGRLGLPEVAAPAIAHARTGFPVSPLTALAWSRAERTLAGVPGFAEVFLPGGRAPRVGERFACPDQAETLARITQTGGADFYRGVLAEQIVAAARAGGAPWSGEDLTAHRAQWVEPLDVEFAGWRLYELPPNCQGLAALAAAGVLERARTRFAEGRAGHLGAAADAHLQIESMKLAFADAHAHVADPEAMRIAPAELIAPGHLDARAAAIDLLRAGDPAAGAPRPGGTVYLCAADADGMAVSYIQSSYMGFGSGIVVAGTGIALGNRGAGFSTDPDHPNVVAPGKRPFSTIIPGFAAGPDGQRLAFGVMGGPMQPQGHLQVLAAIAEGANPQAAVDAPRWRVGDGRDVWVEDAFADDVAADLSARGHAVRAGGPDALFGFGGAQAVLEHRGSWIGASDPRKDGHAAGC